MLDGSSHGTSQQAVRSKIQNWNAALRSGTHANMRIFRGRYKYDYGRRLQGAPVLKPRECVSCRYLSATVNQHQSRWSNAKTILQQTTTANSGPFRIITVQEKTLMGDKHGIPQTELVEEVTHDLEPIRTDRQQPLDSTANPSQINKEVHQEITLEKGSNQKNIFQQQELLVSRIMPHISTGPQTRSVVRLYGYGLSEITIEPPERIPEHFIALYW